MASPRMSAERRSALRRIGLVVGVGSLAAPVVVSAVRPAPLASERFASIDAALDTLARLKTNTPQMKGGWDLAHVLHHAAQSVEYSMTGFPALKPAWFRATVGAYAFALFDARGAMSHDVAEAIPGAHEIAQGQPLAPAIDRAIAALRAFDRHEGALAPHFAYGALDKPAYTRAHLMHLANH
ncbi:MAG: DUF1569 domain-containing protein, partial [Rhizobiales bacterium]|nr:DUF1569 domain-containing protein [Rhizobacter sp.]